MKISASVALIAALALAWTSSAAAHADHGLGASVGASVQQIKAAAESSEPVMLEHGHMPAAASPGAGRQVLAATLSSAGRQWCGSEIGDYDYPSGQLLTDSRKAIKVLYVHPAGTPNRAAQYATSLQQAVDTIRRHVYAESGGSMTLRFDMGTSCGPAYLDIRSMTLSKTAAEYESGTGRADALAIFGEIADRGVGLDGSVLAVVDVIKDSALGVGRLSVGGDAISPDPARNSHNKTAMQAVVWLQHNEPADFVSNSVADTMLHESLHMLGAVQLTAPHSTQGGHCVDGIDIMCSDDGGSAVPAGGILQTCGRVIGVMSKPLDCGKNDYFNPSPAPGSYLDTNWNVARSYYMASCSPLDPEPCLNLDEAVAWESTKRRTLRVEPGTPRRAAHGTLRATATAYKSGKMAVTAAVQGLHASPGRWRLSQCYAVVPSRRTIHPSRGRPKQRRTTCKTDRFMVRGRPGTRARFTSPIAGISGQQIEVPSGHGLAVWADLRRVSRGPVAAVSSWTKQLPLVISAAR